MIKILESRVYMVRIETVVKLTTGLHARPAAELVKLANTFQSSIYLESKDKKINAKDVWEVLSSNIECGDPVSVLCDGSDETNACNSVVALLGNEAL